MAGRPRAIFPPKPFQPKECMICVLQVNGILPIWSFCYREQKEQIISETDEVPKEWEIMVFSEYSYHWIIPDKRIFIEGKKFQVEHNKQYHVTEVTTSYQVNGQKLQGWGRGRLYKDANVSVSVSVWQSHLFQNNRKLDNMVIVPFQCLWCSRTLCIACQVQI